MRSFFLPFLLISTVIFFASVERLMATHAMGADISYQCLGNGQYEITLNFYRDCAGIDAPVSPIVEVSSASCGISQTVTLSQQGSAEVSNLCPSQITSSTCSGGTLPGAQQYIYTGIVTINAECPDWVIQYEECCRNDQISNLQSPGTYDLYAEASFSNVNGLCNSSPEFTSLPVPYICSGQPFNYNHGAIDIDGDSLAYSLIAPLHDPGSSIPYSGSFSPTNPMTLTGPFVFNNITGQMTFTPNGQQVAVVTVLVREFRNGVLIGYTMRDIQVVVINCNNSQPTVSGIKNQVGGVDIDSTTIEICPGQSLSFDFIAADPNGNNLTVTSNVATSIPGASVSYTGSGSSITGHFSWVPSALDTGVNVLTVTATDDACPIPGINILSFNIYVLDGTYAGPDLSYCPAGGPVQLSAIGGTSFTWTPSSGLSNPNIANPLASPNVTTTYIVTSNLGSGCGNTDTVTISVVPDFVWSVLPINDTVDICRNSLTQLEVIADPNYAPYTYAWSPSGSLSASNISNPIATPDVTTDYIATVTASNGCTIKDTVRVNVVGVGPVVNVTVSDTSVCVGDTVQLMTEVFALDCGPSILGCTSQNPPSAKQFANSGVTFGGTPFEGSSGNNNAKFQILYRAVDLNNAAINAGTITRLAFNVGTKASTGTFQNFTIKMGCTSAFEVNGTNWENASTVVYGPQTVSTTPGSNIFTFSTAYDWDGTSNIVVEICYNNGSNTSPGGADLLMSSATSYIATQRSYDASGSGNGKGCDWSNAQFAYAQIPMTTFYICDPVLSNYTYSWTPTTGLSNATVSNPTAVINQSVTYTVSVTGNNCSGGDFVTVNLDNSHDIDLGADTSICAGDTVVLTATLVGDIPHAPVTNGTNNTPIVTSPTTKILGTGTTVVADGTPYQGFWEDGRVQYLYRASELTAMGVNPGTITQLAWTVVQKNSYIPYSGFTIKMGATSLNSLPTSNFAPAPASVVYGPILYNSILGINQHTLTNTYDWDGQSNLLIEVCFNNNNWTDADLVQTQPTSYLSMSYGFNDGQVGCNLTSANSIVFQTVASRPNLRLTSSDAPSPPPVFTWTPTGSSDSTITVSPGTTTSYVVTADFEYGCMRYDTVTVFVGQGNVDAGTNVSICEGGSTPLTATGGANYTWANTPGLSCYNCANPVASPTVTTTYYVTSGGQGCSGTDSVTVTVNPAPFINFQNDSLLCFLDSITLDAGPGFNSYSWNTTDVTQTIVATTAGVYSVTVTDANGCTASDAINLQQNPSPVVNLGNDTAICVGQSVILDAGNGYATYNWSTSQTSSSITVSQSGNYSVTVTDTTNCPSFDTVFVQLSQVDVNLGPDTTLCPDVVYPLIAGPAGINYTWSDNTTDSSLLVTQPGTYSVTASDNIGCVDSDTVVIGYYPAMPVDLGPDTSTCNNQIVVLDAGAGYSSYVWSTASISQTIQVVTGDTFSVTVTDGNSCAYSDSVVVTDLTSYVSLGADINLCQGTSATLDAGAGYTNYNWSTNDPSIQSITVSSGGTYSVTVTQANGCTSVDTVIVTQVSNPTPSLGPDVTICDGDPYVLNPGTYASYAWSNLSSGATLTIFTDDTYSVTVTDANGCTGTDTIVVSVFSDLTFEPSFVNICAGETATLTAPADFVSYEWSTGSTGSTTQVTSGGTYTFTVTDNNGCEGEGEVTVIVETLEVVAIADPTEIDQGESSNLSADVINGSGAYSYSWTPEASLDDATIATPVASPEETTIYVVLATDLESGCSGVDSVEVVVGTEYAIPSAFTPNGDGVNDLFKILTTGNVVIKEFKIFNRWGEMIYSGEQGWDGTHNGNIQPVGTYVYYAILEFPDGSTGTISDSFSLFR